MLRIIPAIDLIDGKCVRLTKGDYRQKIVYNEKPVEVARVFEDNGLKYLHLVDLDGAKSGRIINWKVLNEISSKTKLKIDFGGGIKTENDLHIAFENGASQLNIGSLAIENKSLFLSWLSKYSKDKIILSADVRNEKVTFNGWQENSGFDIIGLIRDFTEKGLENVTCTDVNKDGTLQGPSICLYNKILNNFPKINLIASGGISSISDIDKLGQTKVFGVIVGKAIYENRIKLCELKKYAD